MQVNKSKINIIFFSWMIAGMVVLTSSCIKEYWPKLESGGENLLVVDGQITNAAGPYTVKLSRSSSVQSPEFIPFQRQQ